MRGQNRFLSFLFFIGTALALGCKSKQTDEFAQKQAQLSNQLVAAHKNYVKEEAAIIDTFLLRKSLTMHKTPTGLRYKLYNNGQGPLAATGNQVAINCCLYLLNGTLCNAGNTSINFKVGMADLPTGLHELVQLMHAGDSAVAVLPVHLAYGLSGEGNVPPESTLFCAIKLINIKSNSH